MSDSSEGISFSVPASPLPRFLLQETAGQQHHFLPPAQGTPLHPAAGSLWQEEAEEGGQVAACPGVLQPKTGGGTRCTTVAYVINEASPGVQTSETAALRSLREACEGAAASLHMLDFGKLDFGETSVLDHFYNADIAVVEMSDAFRQPSLFYHLGVRESFSRANNIILYCDNNAETLQSLKEIICQKNNMCTGNYSFVPYMITPHNKVYCCDSSFMKGLTELMQPNFELLLGPICLPLADRFTQILREAQATSRT